MTTLRRIPLGIFWGERCKLLRGVFTFIILTVIWLVSVASATASGIPIAYTLSKPSNVSVNIYDAHGQVVRELMHGLTRPAGKSIDIWDGLGDDNKPVPVGNYTWKLLATPGLKAEYLMSLGNSYPNAINDWRGRAPGTHGGPMAVAVDDTGIYSATYGSENIENYLVKMDPTGAKRLWSQFPSTAWVGAVKMASDGGTLYILASNGEIWPYDAKTGQAGATYKLPVDDELPTVLSARGGFLALAYPKHNLVAWADPGSKVLTDRVALEKPVDVAITQTGDILALTETSVFKISRTDKTPRMLIQGLTSAYRIDVDSSTGDILVAETGAIQQVRRFSPLGAQVATYGRVGGRQDGVYHPQDFREVSDITCDGAGGFFVSEPASAPRRTAHFDHSGKLLHEWYGGQTWGSWVFPEPDNPNAVWMNSSWSDMMRLELDYTTRTWRVQSTYRYAGMAEGLVPGHTNGDLWEGRVHNGVLFLCRSGGDPIIFRVDRKAWRIAPCVVCDGHIKHDLASKPKLITDAMGSNASYQWTDSNGDGKPQLSEVKWYQQEKSSYNLSSIDANLSYIFYDGATIQKYAISRWNAVGSPAYGSFPAGVTLAPSPPRATSIEVRWGSYFGCDDATGDIYGALNDRMPDWGKSLDSFVTKWDKYGKAQWTVGHIGTEPGSIWRAFRRCVGITHGCPVFTGFAYEWANDGPTATYVWDKDGLWVGSVFDNPDLTVADEHLYSLGAEALSATIWTNSKTGQALLYGCWLNEARVYRISGWDGWQRDSGNLAVTPALLQDGTPVRTDPSPMELSPAHGVGLEGVYFANDQYDPKGIKMTRIDPTIDFAWGVWDQPDFKAIPEIGHIPFSIRWTGELVPRRTGLYAFRSGYSSIAKIHVAGAEFREPTFDRGKGRYRVQLEAGKPYNIEIDYSTYFTHPSLYHGIRLEWLQAGSGTWQAVPTSQLYPSGRPKAAATLH